MEWKSLINKGFWFGLGIGVVLLLMIISVFDLQIALIGYFILWIILSSVYGGIVNLIYNKSKNNHLATIVFSILIYIVLCFFFWIYLFNSQGLDLFG